MSTHSNKDFLSFQEQLGSQITNDFHTAFSTENAKSFSPSKQLAEACLVIISILTHAKSVSIFKKINKMEPQNPNVQKLNYVRQNPNVRKLNYARIWMQHMYVHSSWDFGTKLVRFGMTIFIQNI